MSYKICISHTHKFVTAKTLLQQQAHFLLYFVVLHKPTLSNVLTDAAMNLDPGATFDNGYILDIDTSSILGEAFLPLDSLSDFSNVEMDCDGVFFNWLAN
jgi:hypothetical protein